jgi:hypothetical protein
MVHQTVTVKEGDKSKRMTKGEALIKVIMNKANNGDTPDCRYQCGTSKIE